MVFTSIVGDRLAPRIVVGGLTKQVTLLFYSTASVSGRSTMIVPVNLKRSVFSVHL